MAVGDRDPRQDGMIWSDAIGWHWPGNGALSPPVLDERPRCPHCDDPAERWWNYCAVCGCHLALTGLKD